MPDAEKNDEIVLSKLLENVLSGLIDGQMSLDLQGITTEQLLENIKMPPQSIIIAIVETVDQQGNLINVEQIFNEQPISLLELGISPVFLKYADTSVSLKTVTRLCYMNAGLTHDYQNIFSMNPQKGELMNRKAVHAFLTPFTRPTMELTQQRISPMKLVHSSATSAALSSKSIGENCLCHIKATIRPVS